MAKTGQTVEIAVDQRYVKFNRAFAIGNIFDALVELVTNADDSYGRLAGAGKSRERRILIEYTRRLREASPLTVRDRAEGMTADEMLIVLGKIGGRTAQKGNRGFMGRGLKDCAELGDVVVESIKDERYYRCRVSTDFKLTVEDAGRRVTDADRKNLHVPKANGTSVTINIRPGQKLPLFETVKRELPWHYALRDILSTDSETKVFIRNPKESNEVERVSFSPPEGERLIKTRIGVPSYENAYCDLEVFRHSEPFEQRDGKFRQNGLLVKGVRAIHECSFLLDDVEKDISSSRFFGRLECPYFDYLLEDYDDKTAKNLPLSPGNPRLLVDPNRQKGLIRDHPFVESLISALKPIWKQLLEDERRKSESDRDIESAETRSRLDQLARRLSQLLKEELDEPDQGSEGDDGLRGKYALEQAAIIPEFVRLQVAEERRLTFYIRKANVEAAVFGVECESDAVQIHTSGELVDHERWPDVAVGTIKVKGLSLTEPVVLTARCGDVGADALIEVLPAPDPIRDFTSELEFERKSYTVREKRSRTLKLYIRTRDDSYDGQAPQITSNNPAVVVIKSVKAFRHLEQSNFATAEVVVEGRKLGASANVTAKFGELQATCVVAVKSLDERENAALQIRIVDQDFGVYRSEWKDGVLRIAARHSSIGRYLKPPNVEGGDWGGQDSTHFRLLLAEIIAETVARRILAIGARQRPFDYDDWRDAPDSESIAVAVLDAWERKRKKVLALTHKMMVPEDQIRA